MESVTERAKTVIKTKIMSAIDFLKLSDFEKIQFEDGIELNPQENVDPSIIGRTVDYVSRWYMLGAKGLGKAFHYPFRGLAVAAIHSGHREEFAHEFLESFGKDMKKGFQDDSSIGALCRLASFDVWDRNIFQAIAYHNLDKINPDSATCSNIRTLLKRTIKFYKMDTVKFDEEYLKGGFTDVVGAGDFDFLTSDTLFDLKIAVASTMKSSAKKYILQILMYWIIGQHSGNKIFKNITKIGIFNPRSNTAYVLDMSKVSPDIIRFVEDYVICY